MDDVIQASAQSLVNTDQKQHEDNASGPQTTAEMEHALMCTGRDLILILYACE